VAPVRDRDRRDPRVRARGREVQSEDAVATLSSKGRKRGFCLLGATQRLSKLSKNVASGLKNQFVGTFSQDTDQKRAAGMLGFGKERWTEIRDLSGPGHEGEFFCYGPAFNHRGVIKMRSGAVETTHPQAGVGRPAEPPAPSAKIKGVLAELKDIPAQAAAEIKDLAAAKAEIDNLRRQLRQQPKPAATVVSHATTKQDAAAIARLTKGLDEAMKALKARGGEDRRTAGRRRRPRAGEASGRRRRHPGREALRTGRRPPEGSGRTCSGGRWRRR
jgi:hypothetical protein